ncbi:MAG: hypothetical protein HFE62_00950 [Firmicutes bacterium]|nr:hypothetical protein [Bacillota bacterium]
MEYIKKHKELHMFFILIFIIMNIVSFCVVSWFDNENFDYFEGYEKTSEYPWSISGDDCGLNVVGEHEISAWWKENSNKIYLYMFDGSSGLMSDEYKELASIPEKARKIQFDCTMNLKAGQTIVAYIIQYDDNGRIAEADKIEKLETYTIDKTLDRNILRNYSIKTNVYYGAKYYKVLFDIRTQGVPGKLVLDDIDVIFN